MASHRPLARWLGLLVVGSGAVFSCSETSTETGGLMLAISADGSLPIDRVDISIASQGRVLHDTHYRVPEEAELPTTIAVASNGDARASVQIVVVGWNGDVPVDRRDAIVTQVPTERVALLRVVLSGECSTKVRLTDGLPESTCSEGDTCNPLTGDCTSASVDASELPSYQSGDESRSGLGGAPAEGLGGGGSGTVASAAGQGQAGTESSGGQASGASAGAPGSGEAGQAGASNPPVEACLGCGAGSCAEQMDRCEESAACNAWLSCLGACATSDCADACDEAHVDVARIYYGVHACLCNECDAECAVIGACDRQCDDTDDLPATTVLPATLADTGLFVGAGVELATSVRSFTPRYPLWMDGEVSERYIYLPPCASIDSSDMDHWDFPIGTRLWQHVSVGASRLETRFMHRHGAADADWLFASYEWNFPNQPSQAIVRTAGVSDVAGYQHDIPSVAQCVNCHGKLKERVLGFSAFQLSHAGAGQTIELIGQLGWLTNAPAAGFDPPGTAVQRAALGYLHGNCGNCHNDADLTLPDFRVRLLVGQTAYAATDTVLTTVDVATVSAMAPLAGKPRIAPADPSNSTVLVRMQAKETAVAMPPLATRATTVVDASGVAAVSDWIDSL